MSRPVPTPAPVARVLSARVHTLGQDLLRRYGQRVHKLAINAGFTCPNRDGTKGHGGCTFCNNQSFSPNAQEPPTVTEQIAAGRAVLARRTGARRFIAYFQAYTNTYDRIDRLRARYDEALAIPDVLGISVGTRPDCVPEAVLDLLAGYRAQGKEVWLELGLQSADDRTLERVNRGHGFAEFQTAARAAQRRGIKVCAHLIIGLPGEGRDAALWSLERVLNAGVAGLKLHPLHVVRHTRLANAWGRGDYLPLALDEYAGICADLIEQTPPAVVFHRLTGTAAPLHPACTTLVRLEMGRTQPHRGGAGAPRYPPGRPRGGRRSPPAGPHRLTDHHRCSYAPGVLHGTRLPRRQPAVTQGRRR